MVDCLGIQGTVDLKIAVSAWVALLVLFICILLASCTFLWMNKMMMMNCWMESRYLCDVSMCVTAVTWWSLWWLSSSSRSSGTTVNCDDDVCVLLMQFEEAVGCLPDTSFPVAEQLEQAVTTIKRNVKLILDTKAQMEVCKKVGMELCPWCKSSYQ